MFPKRVVLSKWSVALCLVAALQMAVPLTAQEVPPAQTATPSQPAQAKPNPAPEAVPSSPPSNSAAAQSAAPSDTEAVGTQEQNSPSAKSADNKRAKKKGKFGAIFGAIAGAVVGAAIGGKKGALIGAAAGAAIGGAIGYNVGKHQDRLLATRDDVVRRIGGVPASNYLVIKEIRLHPSDAQGNMSPDSCSAVHPGDTVWVECVYDAVPPNESETPAISYCHSIIEPDTTKKTAPECPKAENPSKGGGEMSTTFPITVSQLMSPQTYQIELSLNWDDQQVAGQVPFIVVGT
jgi:hypothetical protein